MTETGTGTGEYELAEGRRLDHLLELAAIYQKVTVDEINERLSAGDRVAWGPYWYAHLRRRTEAAPTQRNVRASSDFCARCGGPTQVHGHICDSCSEGA